LLLETQIEKQHRAAQQNTYLRDLAKGKLNNIKFLMMYEKAIKPAQQGRQLLLRSFSEVHFSRP
jgi:hypothetical protein